MKIKIGFIKLSIIIPLIFIIGIAGSMAFNIWVTESSKEPANIKEGEFAGQNDPSDIRGSYSFIDITKAFNVPLKDLAQAFNVPDNLAEKFLCKELEETYGTLPTGELGTDSVRLFVSLYTGLPHTIEHNTILPIQAIELLSSKGRLTEEQLKTLKLNAVDLKKLDTQNEKTAETQNKTEIKNESEIKTETVDTTIKGKTTFGDLLLWKLTKEEIENILGNPIGKSNEAVRDFCESKGIEFLDIKTKLQELIDKKK